MIASGRQTAPPQVIDYEVVLVTNSACPLQSEASPRVSDLHRVALTAPVRPALMAELCQHLAPGIVHAASASRILSVPTVSCT
jgi:hypothetical protein